MKKVSLEVLKVWLCSIETCETNYKKGELFEIIEIIKITKIITFACRNNIVAGFRDIGKCQMNNGSCMPAAG